MIETAIQTLTENQDLTYDQSHAVIDEIMSGHTTDIQIASFLTGLAVKTATVPEIAGAAAAMRAHALAFPTDEAVLEIVGTGGDHSNSFNISTTTALVVSATGIPVAKHGNRAASSKSGAADVLEALGVNITVDPQQSATILRQIGLCFLFAQEYHQAMKYVAPVRQALGIRTLFNILGPLANPAHATAQVLGVYDDALVVPMAKVLQQLGLKHAMVVHGQDGFDEVSLSAPPTVAEINGAHLTTTTLTPEQFGLQRCDKAAIIGGSPADNAAITRAVLNGQPSPQRDVVVFNAGCAIHTARPELSIQAGINLAQAAIDDGAALQQLTQLIALTKAGQAA